MDGAKVSILKETDQVCLRGLLQGSNGGRLETEVSLEILGNFSHKTLEGQLADEKLCALLVPANLTQGYSSWPEPVWLLHTT